MEYSHNRIFKQNDNTMKYQENIRPIGVTDISNPIFIMQGHTQGQLTGFEGETYGIKIN